MWDVVMSLNANERRPPSGDEVGALYALIGEAVWHLQHVENALSVALAVKLDLKDAALGSISQGQADAILAKRRRPTLGVAVGLAREKAIFSEQLKRRLETFLDERNWLIHRIMYQNGDDMNINGRRELVLARVDHLVTEARRIQSLIGDELVQFMSEKGLSRQQIMERAQHDFLKGRGII